MKKVLSILLLFSSLTSTAQSIKTYNDPRAKLRTLTGAFTQISVSSGVQLYLTQSNEESLATSVSDDKYEERFKAEVVNGILKIYYDNKGIGWTNDRNRKLKAWLSVKTLEKITGAAGSNVVLTNELNVPNLGIDFSSGAQFSGSVKATLLNASATSGANISIAGTAEKIDISANSGAAFKGYDLVSQFCTAHANSGAEVKIEVQKELKASANSGGSIAYEGDAILNKGNINSGGSVKKAH
jgi:Putative auto-transporter adhesin, head GIN domain